MAYADALIDRYGILPGTIAGQAILNALDRKNFEFLRVNSDQFFNEQRDAVLHVIIDRFGIGGLMAAKDRIGGNVDTIHNARAGIYATKEEQRRYEQRGKYDSAAYHSDKRYVEKNRQARIAQKNGALKDGYTGQTVKQNQTIDQDHIKSAKSIHDDPGRVLAEEDGVDLANQDSNLTQTDRSINRGKKQKSASEYADLLDRTRPERRRRIKELQSQKSLTDKERKELNKLQRQEQVDTAELRRKGNNAETAYEYRVNMKYYCSRKFIANLGWQSAIQGAQMGIRQIAGVFLVEAIAAVFDELRDVCRTARQMTGAWLSDLRCRISRILKRVASKWEDALNAGCAGAISSFFSNILTVLINVFVTTAKNIVRLIREGFFSIMQAVDLIANPPAGMSRAALYHEAGKIIITGSIVVFGIVMEETISTFPPMFALKSLPAVGSLLGDIVYGFLVALITSLALWGWDKLDLFNAKEEKRHIFMMDAMRNENKETIKKRKEWLLSIQEENPHRYYLLKKELAYVFR
jgi:hypothetical protein